MEPCYPVDLQSLRDETGKRQWNRAVIEAICRCTESRSLATSGSTCQAGRWLCLPFARESVCFGIVTREGGYLSSPTECLR